jgi:hypothetical protein
MALPVVLAALPAIFSAIESVGDLFTEGKKVYEQVTGTPSAATAPAELSAEVRALTPEQTAAWVESMRVSVDAYKAETERLVNEQGEVTPELLKTLTPAAATRVALMRMTTRPIIALRMSHVILLSIYLTILDACVSVINLAVAGFGGTTRFELLTPVLFGTGGSIYLSMYQEVLPYATFIVIGYMSGRTLEKLIGKDGGSVQGVKGGIGGAMRGAFGAVKGLFGGKK